MTTKYDRVANGPALRFLSTPGVNVIFGGEKISDGNPTGRTALRFGVTSKKPASEIPASHILPSEYQGCETDVFEFPPVFALNAIPTGNPLHKHRPVIGGISGFAKYPGATAGTIGCVMYDPTSKRYVALTNNHCAGLRYEPIFAHPNEGRIFTGGMEFCQPAYYDAPEEYPGSVIGEVLRAVPMFFGTSPGTPLNKVDAAIVSINSVNNAWYSFLNFAAGPIRSNAYERVYSWTQPADGTWRDRTNVGFKLLPTVSLAVGDTVTKVGRTTGVTSGVVSSANAAVTVHYGTESDNNQARFTNQIYVPGAGIAAPGDSGSAVIKDFENNSYALHFGERLIVGLLFAGNTDGFFANHIRYVQESLQITHWADAYIERAQKLRVAAEKNIHFWKYTVSNLPEAISSSYSGIVLPRSTDPVAMVNGRRFLRIQDVTRPQTHTPDVE